MRGNRTWALVCMALLGEVAGAATPTQVGYQGLVLDAQGTPLNQTIEATVRIYGDPLSTDPADLLFEETHTGVQTVEGVFSLAIGSVLPGGLTASVLQQADLWIEVEIDGETLSPRQSLLAVPFSLRAEDADGVGGVPAAGIQQAISAACPPGEAIQDIAPDGSVFCTPTGGDITAVNPGAGLIGGGESGDVTLSIGQDAVTAFHLGDSSVGPAEIATGAVGSDEVAANSLTAADLASNSVGFAEITLGAVRSGEILDQSILAMDLATNSVTAAAIVEGAVGSSEVLDQSLTASDLAPNSVTASEIAAGAVGTSELQSNAVEAAEIATGAVRSSEVLDQSLTAADFAPNSVTAAAIAAGAVGASEIQSSAVEAAEIATGAVGTSEIADGSVMANDMFNEAGVEYASIDSTISLTSTESTVESVTMTLPSSGHVVVTATAVFAFTLTGTSASCGLTQGTTMEIGHTQFQPGFSGNRFAVALTRGFAVGSGSQTFRLVCDATGSVILWDPHMTAVYSPTRY